MRDSVLSENLESALGSIPRLAEGVIHRTLGDETVILDPDKGQYYVVNETATAIWDLCDGKRTLADIIETLCNEFDVSREAAQSSLARLMNDLVEAHLVVLDANDHD